MENSMPELRAPDNILIVGCGGVASYLLPCLIKLLVRRACNVTLMDGDNLEVRNLDRQLFSVDMVGQNKAKALAGMFNNALDTRQLQVVPEYFVPGTRVADGSLVMVCADNHSARRAALSACDETFSDAIIGGNEYTDADAYYYSCQWKDSPLDPRRYFPEILTDNTGDPTRPQGCQGEAQAQTPQLALANMSAANHMLWLFWFYYAEIHLMKADYMDFWPVRHSNSFSRFGTSLIKELKAKGVAA